MEFSEDLQIANYGLGGQYEPHYDHATKKNRKTFNKIGNRMATAMIYLSDVEMGGYTIFNYAGHILKPQKGTMVLWYNLKRNGESDPMTRHAGCPVVIGAKWIANLWIHEYGQEFRRKC